MFLFQVGEEEKVPRNAVVALGVEEERKKKARRENKEPELELIFD